ncbi:MAG: hypothetical protein M5T61_05665 [Acidimicrobiia bacterium]|nr:hypothetical protein [Acidimicrobiia bacterium]
MWLASGRDSEIAASLSGPQGDPESAGSSEPRVILVTSPGANEGKSATAANLAAAIAETGRSVVLLDLDFRRPQVHRYLDGGRAPGLGELGDDDTDGNGETQLEDLLQPTAMEGLRFAAAMADDTPPAVAVARARRAIEAASLLADVVVLDTPPLLLANDTYDLMAGADALVLVVREGRTDESALRRASELLLRTATPIVGITLIAAPGALGYGSYTSNKRYGPADESGPRGRVRALLGRARRDTPSSESDDLIRLS